MFLVFEYNEFKKFKLKYQIHIKISNKICLF